MGWSVSTTWIWTSSIPSWLCSSGESYRFYSSPLQHSGLPFLGRLQPPESRCRSSGCHTTWSSQPACCRFSVSTKAGLYFFHGLPQLLLHLHLLFQEGLVCRGWICLWLTMTQVPLEVLTNILFCSCAPRQEESQGPKAELCQPHTPHRAATIAPMAPKQKVFKLRMPSHCQVLCSRIWRSFPLHSPAFVFSISLFTYTSEPLLK